MECYYHPERESTDVCAICGKSVCKECGLEIAGKIYCKDCLEKIVGIGLSNAAAEPADNAVKTEPARLNKQTSDDSVYTPQDVEPITPQHNDVQEQYESEAKPMDNDSPYNIKDNMEYSGGLESSYMDEPAQQVVQEEIPQQTTPDDEFIYPDHSYEPEPRAGENLEDKYERYLDDLYFDENEIPLTEQLAKDEEQYGSLTKKPHKVQKPAEERKSVKEPGEDRKLRKKSGDEEIEAKIRAEIEKEMREGKGEDGKTIHNLNYQQEKEPLGALDIILTIILIIIILIVVYYLIYLFILNSSYPTFMDAIYGLSNPQNVINNILK